MLVEYRPGRYVWTDVVGKVIRPATDEEADEHLSRLAGLERTAPLVVIPEAVETTAEPARPEPASAVPCTLPEETATPTEGEIEPGPDKESEENEMPTTPRAKASRPSASRSSRPSACKTKVPSASRSLPCDDNDIGPHSAQDLAQTDVDWRSLKEGEAVCPACGAVYPGGFNYEWLFDADDRLHHWCSGGRPGVWQPAILAPQDGGN